MRSLGTMTDIIAALNLATTFREMYSNVQERYCFKYGNLVCTTDRSMLHCKANLIQLVFNTLPTGWIPRGNIHCYQVVYL